MDDDLKYTATYWVKPHCHLTTYAITTMRVEYCSLILGLPLNWMFMSNSSWNNAFLSTWG